MVHTEMYATNGSRMTAFEGTARVNREVDDDDDWLKVDIGTLW